VLIAAGDEGAARQIIDNIEQSGLDIKDYGRYRKYQESLHAEEPATPFIDPKGSFESIDAAEKTSRDRLAEQQKAAQRTRREHVAVPEHVDWSNDGRHVRANSCAQCGATGAG
jgi:hypothetical protein